ncbi:MAG: hypothetical protein QXP66_01760 [Candidatus Aenigmatarchaeota archaeon]
MTIPRDDILHKVRMFKQAINSLLNKIYNQYYPEIWLIKILDRFFESSFYTLEEALENCRNFELFQDAAFFCRYFLELDCYFLPWEDIRILLGVPEEYTKHIAILFNEAYNYLKDAYPIYAEKFDNLLKKMSKEAKYVTGVCKHQKNNRRRSNSEKKNNLYAYLSRSRQFNVKISTTTTRSQYSV